MCGRVTDVGHQRWNVQADILGPWVWYQCYYCEIALLFICIWYL